MSEEEIKKAMDDIEEELDVYLSNATSAATSLPGTTYGGTLPTPVNTGNAAATAIGTVVQQVITNTVK